MGEDEFVAIDRPFQSMKAVERTRAKFRAWVRVWRAEEREVEREGSIFEVLFARGDLRDEGRLYGEVAVVWWRDELVRSIAVRGRAGGVGQAESMPLAWISN